MNKFEVGDIVEAFGLKGKITNIYDKALYPLEVNFENNHIFGFMIDGKYANWHKEPSLKFISRPKKKVKKSLKGWINIYPENRTGSIYESKEQADTIGIHNRIAITTVSIEYEVEET